jgi:hypothetical protein
MRPAEAPPSGVCEQAALQLVSIAGRPVRRLGDHDGEAT